MGVTNQELINRAALGHQPGSEEHDPRNDVLTSAKRASQRKHTKYDAICSATGSTLSPFAPFALETTGGHGASTLASVYHRYLLSTKQMRAAGQAQRTLALRALVRPSAEDEEQVLALNRRASGFAIYDDAWTRSCCVCLSSSALFKGERSPLSGIEQVPGQAHRGRGR
jgi:hypothetical protein